MAAAKTLTDRNYRQRRVAEWCAKAFGKDHAASVKQRAVRFAEEAIELAQACDADPEMLHRLIDHVYARPVGDRRQEFGGVGVTLLALAEACRVSADAAERDEFRRVRMKPLAHFAERNAAKNAAGFDVLAPQPSACDTCEAAMPEGCGGRFDSHEWCALHRPGK